MTAGNAVGDDDEPTAENALLSEDWLRTEIDGRLGMMMTTAETMKALLLSVEDGRGPVGNEGVHGSPM